MAKTASLTKFLDQCPPFLVVALARKPGTKRKRGMSLRDISKHSGVSQRTLQRLFARDTWAGTQVGDADAILTACKINIFRMGNARAYLKEAMLADKPFGSLPPTSRQELINRMARWAANGKRAQDGSGSTPQ